METIQNENETLQLLNNNLEEEHNLNLDVIMDRADKMTEEQIKANIAEILKRHIR